jgi:hypothetical protein
VIGGSFREGRRKNVVWLQPTLIAEIEYRAWTDDGKLRHASYKGLREVQDNAEVCDLENSQTATVRNDEAGPLRHLTGAAVKNGPSLVLIFASAVAWYLDHPSCSHLSRPFRTP